MIIIMIVLAILKMSNILGSKFSKLNRWWTDYFHVHVIVFVIVDRSRCCTGSIILVVFVVFFHTTTSITTTTTTTTTTAADQRQQQAAAAATAAAAADEVAKPAAESCHDAVPGEACWQAVTWAKNSGIHQHPEWYRGLSASSAEAEFQALVHSATPDKCPAPCVGVAVSSCRDPTPGDACWGAVDWAKKHGIHEHPEWYPYLSPASSDADFQAQVHAAKPSKCPVPCGAGARGNAAAAAASPAAPQGPSCASYGCGGRYIQSQSCQCNQHCSRFGNCCSDYAAKCSR